MVVHTNRVSDHDIPENDFSLLGYSLKDPASYMEKTTVIVKGFLIFIGILCC